MTTTRSTRVAVQVAGAALVLGCGALVAYGYTNWQGTPAPAEQPAPRVAITTSPVPLAGEEYADPSWAIEPNGDADRSGQGDDGSDGHAANEHKGEPPAWKAILDGFAHDFNRVEGTSNNAIHAWRRQMTRWVTPHLAEAYKTVDPRMLPNTTIDDIEVQSDGAEAVTAVIDYHGIQPVWVLLQPTPDGWRVTQAEPADGN